MPDFTYIEYRYRIKKSMDSKRVNSCSDLTFFVILFIESLILIIIFVSIFDTIKK